jgi:PKD repeat protein
MSLGQSSIEYLTTYGWMVVAVSIVGGTIYTQIDVSDGCTLGTSGFSPPFPTVTETYQYDNGTVFLEVTNPGEDSIELSNITVSQGNRTLGAIGINREIIGEGTEPISTNRFQTSENCNERTLQINYESDTLQGLTAEGTIQGKISITPLVALFNMNVTALQPGEAIKFNASQTESQNSIEGYNWEFGDGETASGREPTHEYTDGGVYIVRLTVEDSQGITDTTRKRVYVGGVLTREGGYIPRLGFQNSLATGCIGPNCQNVTGTDDKPISTSGDYTEGTIFTEELVMTNSSMCITDPRSFETDQGCSSYQQGTDEAVSSSNYNFTGSLRTPGIKPQDQSLCIGKCM